MIKDSKIISAAIEQVMPRLPSSLYAHLNATAHINGVIDGLALSLSHGADAARGKLDALQKEQEFKRGIINQQISVVNAQIAHFNMAKRALDSGGLDLRPVNNSPAAPSLRSHEIIGQLKSNLAPLLINLSGGLMQKHENQKPRRPEIEPAKIAEAVKFDLRRLRPKDIWINADFARELRANGLFRPPFDLVWYEWEIEAGATMGALHQWGDFEKFEWWARVPGSGWAYWRSGATIEGELAFGIAVSGVIDAACTILQSRCAEKVPVEPTWQFNDKRVRAGKPPLFSHTIVEIRALHIDHHGNQVMIRRSPRQHWRRGHIRRLRDDFGAIRREIPIAPMLIGNLTHGKVSHDYILPPPNLADYPRPETTFPERPVNCRQPPSAKSIW